MHITRVRDTRTVSLDQSKYIRDIMDKHGMTDCKSSPLTMDPDFVPGLARIDSPPLTGVATDIYPSLLGSLQFAAVCTRLDVSTALSILGSGQANPTEVHLQALKKVVRYLNGTLHIRQALGGRRPQPKATTHASPSPSGRMTAAPASHAPSTCSHLAAALSTTSPSISHVPHNTLAKLSTTLHRTPPRRDSTYANSWGRSSTPSSPKLPPYV
jgi:hypothetical protein